MRKETDTLKICKKDTSPQEMAGEFFLRKVISFIESKFSDEIMMERTIELHKLYRLLGRNLSIPKEDIRFLLKMLERRFPEVSRNCRGLIVSSEPKEEEEDD